MKPCTNEATPVIVLVCHCDVFNINSKLKMVSIITAKQLKWFCNPKQLRKLQQTYTANHVLVAKPVDQQLLRLQGNVSPGVPLPLLLPSSPHKLCNQVLQFLTLRQDDGCQWLLNGRRRYGGAGNRSLQTMSISPTTLSPSSPVVPNEAVHFLQCVSEQGGGLFILCENLHCFSARRIQCEGGHELHSSTKSSFFFGGLRTCCRSEGGKYSITMIILQQLTIIQYAIPHNFNTIPTSHG